MTGRSQASSQVGLCLIPTLYATPLLPVLSQARVSVTDSVRFFLPIVNPSPLLPGLRNAAGLSCNSKASLGTSVQTHYNSALNCLGHKQSNFTDWVFLCLSFLLCNEDFSYFCSCRLLEGAEVTIYVQSSMTDSGIVFTPYAPRIPKGSLYMLEIAGQLEHSYDLLSCC